MASLYVVATPIGNLEDVTLRALRVLSEVDQVFAEDTRHTRVLLERHDVRARPKSLHAHNEAARCAEVVAALDAGQDVAIVSDAGTPLVSDPGERVVNAAREAGHLVVPIPGASAVLAALVGSGLRAAPFTFLGFLPRKAGERDALLGSYGGRPETLVLFESPRRLVATLEALANALGDREASVGRELTKRHEEHARGRLSELVLRFGESVRGECTIVVAGGAPEVWDDARVLAELRARLRAGDSAKDVSHALAAASGRPRREIYALAIAEGSSS